MSYSTPSSRKASVARVLRALQEASCVVLTTHINADGDGAGSQAALAGWCRAQGKDAWIVNPTPFPRPLEFLLSDRSWALDSRSTAAGQVVGKADLAVVVDTGEGPRIGPVQDLIRDLPRVIVDHHPPGPHALEGVSLRDPGASAAGELVYDILLEAGGPWPEETVRGLYVAVLADTGSFRFSNSSPAAHRIVAELIERGAEPEVLHRLVYGNVPLRKLRLLHASLAHLEVDPEGTLAWMTVPQEAFDELGGRAEDIEGLVDFPRDIEGVEVAVLFRRAASGATKISLRSNGDVDVNALARQFGGGGHIKASGALVEGPLEVVRETVLETIRSALGGRKFDDDG